MIFEIVTLVYNGQHGRLISLSHFRLGLHEIVYKLTCSAVHYRITQFSFTNIELSLSGIVCQTIYSISVYLLFKFFVDKSKLFTQLESRCKEV